MSESHKSLAKTIKEMAAFSTGGNPIAMQMKQIAGEPCAPNEVVVYPVSFNLSMMLELQGEPLVVAGNITIDGARSVLTLKDVTADM